MKIKKIHIVGVYGSGKSTLAKRLHQITKYNIYGLDKIKYKREYDKIRSPKRRLKIVKQISNKKTWITEGTWLDYALDLYKKADVVIFLEIPRKILYKRVLIRYLKRKLGKEKYFNNNLKTTFKIINKIKKYFKDPRDFITLRAHKNYMEKHSKKVIILKNKKQINDFIKSIK